MAEIKQPPHDTVQSPLSAYWQRTSETFGVPERAKPLMMLGAISLLLSLLSLAYLLYSVPKRNALIHNVAELRILSQQLSTGASQASVVTNPQAFASLQNLRNQFNERLAEVHDQYSGSELDTIDKQWTSVDASIGTILKNQALVKDIHDQGTILIDTIPEIQAEYNSIVDGMVRQNLPPSQVATAKNQVLLAERILRSVSTILSSDSGTASANDFGADVEDFGRVLNGQLNGDSTLGVQKLTAADQRSALQTIKANYDKEIKDVANKILTGSPQIYQVREASAKASQEVNNMIQPLGELNSSAGKSWHSLVPGFILLLSLGSLFYSAYRLLQMRNNIEQERALIEVKRQREEAEKEAIRSREVQAINERNQMAILRLLDELGDLADGDLTVNATVSEDFTGAIADSVNFAIDQLRQLVSAINTTAVQVEASSQDTQSTAMQLAEASEHQAQEIAGASAAVNEMAVSIDQVSANAMESASVANRSVAIAHNGGAVVQRSIEGMDTIRDQIQETAKRIKRLGESSQEIGDIVSLINDIADQTNILALNAAIQASMAGEAGRGFAVVADEVQRLAERSAGATKQIEGLVKTIQTDTNEAVISMEQTTAEVVRGANLAKDAGVALDEIQSVSKSLAELIQSISNAARQQAASAGHISHTMNIIQQITTQTTTGTMATARSVGHLAEMASELRSSVSDFKLPEDSMA